MNMYLVQTVSTRPRPWSSYTNINNSKDVRIPIRMNSAEEISKYHDNNSHYCSPVLARRAARSSYDFPEKSPKKDKKWSLGSLFRRKKKPGSESSSEDENDNKNFLQRRKKRTDKRKRTNKAVGFDHVVIPSSSRPSTTLSNGYKYHNESTLSESPITDRGTNRNFIPASDFTTKFVPLKESQENFKRNGINRSNNSLGSPSLNSLGRRRREISKARAEARRDSSKAEDSSDDDSQRSAFKSNESLSKPKDGSLSRKSRAARTQRYLRRLSKDEEPQEQLRMCKSDIEHDYYRNIKLADERMHNIRSHSNKSPTLNSNSATKPKLFYANSAPSSRPNLSGLSTIPPHGNQKHRATNLTKGNLYKQSSSFHNYNDSGNKYVSTQRSLSCGSDIHNGNPSPVNEDEIVHVQFHLGKPFNKYSSMIVNHQTINAERRQPPPPPPRDPRRILSIQNYDGRPISYSFENGSSSRNNSDQHLNKPHPIPEINKNPNLNPKCRSTSEDHISWEPTQRVPLVPRPSSATPEANQLQKLNGKNESSISSYRYLADKNPRSRKPICIQSYNKEERTDQFNKSQKPFDFWKQKDEEVARSNTKTPNNNSPLMFTAQTHVRTNIFLPNGISAEINTNQADTIKRESSPFRPITPTKSQSPPSVDKVETHSNSLDEPDATTQRKSSNLEDALDELEAIYNSLHLGDEDLLERAEQREVAAAQKRKDALLESFPNSMSRGTLSDSSFGYDLNFDSSRKKRHLKRAEPDRKADDMAYRKLNKDRYNTISDPQSVVSKVSYLLTSPVFSKTVDDESVIQKGKEPDVTFDDVVYRNVKHTNNTLKVADPQPPFGIPIGPVLLASNSDYLHAMPENGHRYTFQSKKIPDVVKDDLAFRNLRKDPNKEPALPKTTLNNIDDFINNNNSSNNKHGESPKKKRAVRSLSANIFNLMQKEWKENTIRKNDNDSKDQNIDDVADALEIARKILKEKEDKINATKKAFMSDGELKYRKFEQKSPSEQRLNFLNQMKSSNSSDKEQVYHHKLQVNIPVTDFERLDAKPPTPDRSRRSSRPSTKESTPVPTSSSEDAQIKKQLQQSTIDQLLSSLAIETRETSERITNELKVFDEEKQFKRKSLSSKDDNSDKQNERLGLVSEKLKELEENTITASLNLQQLPKGNSTSEHAELCEKLLECVVDSKVEQEPSEEVASMKDESIIPESVANIVLTPDDIPKSEMDPVSTEVFSESDHDYVNVNSSEELEKSLEIEMEAAKASTDDNLCSDIHVDSVFEVGSSTEVDDEERELLLIDDDAVSRDICTSPLIKHKIELLAAFDELRIPNGTCRLTTDVSSSENASKNSRSIEQTNKDGGEECVSIIEYIDIALPVEGCDYSNEIYLDVGSVNEERSGRQVSVLDFDLSQKVISNSEVEGSIISDLSNVDIWINDDDALDSLKSPKLVQNLNTALVSDSNNMTGEVDESFARNLEIEDRGRENFSCDSNSVKFDFFMERENFNDDVWNVVQNLVETLDDSNRVDSSQILNLEQSLDQDLGNTSSYEPDQNVIFKNEWSGCPTENASNFEQNCVQNINFESIYQDGEQPNELLSLQSKNSFDKKNTNINRNTNVDCCSQFYERAECSSAKNQSDSFKAENARSYDNNESSCITRRDKSKLSTRESRHTLVESKPSRSWYEDPAVIAVACSCGLACTTQLSSFDIIAVLGLLFAIISLFIALLIKT